MKILHRFLLQHFMRILLLSLGAFISIYLLVDFFEKISDFIDHRATGGDYLSYLLNSIPPITVQILPLAILMTVVLTLGGLGRTNEVTAMRASGISLWKIIQPFMFLALLLSGLLMGLNEYVVPHNVRVLNQLVQVKLKGKTQLSLSRDEIWYRHGSKIINVKLAQPGKAELHGVTVYDIDQNMHIHQRLDAGLVSYVDQHWQAKDLVIRDFDPLSGDLLKTQILPNQPLDLGRTPRDFSSQELRNNELNYRQLAQMVKKLEREGYDATRQRVDMYLRLASPFTCLIMGFLGVPFALQKGRQSNIALGVGLSLGIGVAYFLLQSMLVAFGHSGALPPIVAAWATNIIFLMLGVWMLLSVKE